MIDNKTLVTIKYKEYKLLVVIKLGTTIGKGTFGKVKLGIHKYTG